MVISEDSLVDAHVHVQDEAFQADQLDVMFGAWEAGVKHLVCNGSQESDWELVARAAGVYPGVIPCFGLHPWYVAQRSERWREILERFLRFHSHAGVGEIGLDRWIEPRDEAAQEEVFRTQLEVARQYQRPVMVHCLKAWEWFMKVLESEPALPAGMLIHAYSGPTELIAPLTERGVYFSFAGTVLYENNKRGRAALLAVPAERLLIETDAPDLMPPEAFAPHRQPRGEGQWRNEPANLPAIAGGIAALRGMPRDDFVRLVGQNSRRFLAPIWND